MKKSAFNLTPPSDSFLISVSNDYDMNVYDVLTIYNESESISDFYHNLETFITNRRNN